MMVGGAGATIYYLVFGIFYGDPDFLWKLYASFLLVAVITFVIIWTVLSDGENALFSNALIFTGYLAYMSVSDFDQAVVSDR